MENSIDDLKKWISISESLLNEAPPPTSYSHVAKTGARELAKDAIGLAVPGLGAVVDIISKLKQVSNNREAMKNLVASYMRLPDNKRPPGKNVVDLDDNLSSILDEKFFLLLVDEITAKILPYIYGNQDIPDNFANTIAKQRITKILNQIPG